MKQIGLHQCLLIEFKKNKFIISALLLFIGIILNCLYVLQGRLPQGQEWQMIFASIPFINTLLISIMMSVLASKCIDVENKGNMWNTLPTLYSRTKLYISKLMFGFVHILLFCILQTILLLCFAVKILPESKFPLFYLIFTILSEIIFGMIIFQLQCLLSLRFQSQFAALSIAFGGTLAGVFLAFVSKFSLTPWSVLFSLSTISMDFDSATRQMSLSWNKINILAVLVGLMYFFATFIAGFKVFNTPEAKNFTFIHSKAKSRNIHTILPAELIKLKYNPVWIPFILIPIISAGIGIINFLGNQYVLSFNWDDLWTQESLFLGIFFLSPLIAVLASLLFRMEHHGNNWNIVLTVNSRFKILKDKWLTTSALSIICILWIAIIYIISGKLLGIPGNIPPIFFLRIFTSLICIIAIAGFQCMLSLIIRSFAIPVGLAFLCNIFGLLLNLKGLFYATPFSMLIYSMGSTNITGKLNIPLTILSCLFYVCITFCIGMLYLHKVDIKTGR